MMRRHDIEHGSGQLELSREIAGVRDDLADRIDQLEIEVAELSKDQAVSREMLNQLVIGRESDIVTTRWIIGMIVTGALGAMFTSIGSCIQQREDIASIKATISIMKKE
jgi:hypothetical protein